MERRKEVEDKSIWFQYFRSIRTVCPWSYKSYLEGKIKIIPLDRDFMKLNEAKKNLIPEIKRELKKSKLEVLTNENDYLVKNLKKAG